MKNILLIAIMILAVFTKVSATAQSPNFGIYVTTLFQKNPQNGLTFSDNLKALQNMLNNYSQNKCPKSNADFKIAYILVKHLLDNQQILLNKLKQVLSKFETSSFPKVILHYVTNESLQKYSKGQKFLIPKDPKQSVQDYFLIDLETIVANFTCKFVQFHYQKYRNYFKVDKSKNQNDLSLYPYQTVLPITGFFSAGFNFNNANFIYTRNTAKYYSIIRTNGAFISRHLMDLYFIEISEIGQLRQLVKQKKDCEQIVLNVIVGHYYLQIPPLLVNIPVIQPEILNTNNQKSEMSEMSEIYQKIQSKLLQQYNKPYDNLKSTCINQISNIMGYVPLKAYNSTNPFGVSNWKNPSFDTIAKAKRVLFQSILQGKYNIKSKSEQLQDNANKEIIKKSLNILNDYGRKVEKEKSEQKQDNQKAPDVKQEKKWFNQLKGDQDKRQRQPDHFQQKTQVNKQSQRFIDILIYIQLVIALILVVALCILSNKIIKNQNVGFQNLNVDQP